MKNLFSIILTIIMLACIFVGCEPAESPKKVKFNDITRVTVSLGDNKCKELSDKYRNKIVSLLEQTINESDGFDKKDATIYYGGYYLNFYNDKSEVKGLGINGKNFYYNGKYYPMSSKAYKAVDSMLMSTYYFPERESITKVKLVEYWHGSRLLSDKERENVLDFCAKIISSKKPCRGAYVCDGNDIYFFDKNNKRLDDTIYINYEYLHYKNKIYHLNRKEFEELYTDLLKPTGKLLDD